jgi:hypothetical protein
VSQFTMIPAATDKLIRRPRHPSPAPESPASDRAKEAMITAAKAAMIGAHKARFSSGASTFLQLRP